MLGQIGDDLRAEMEVLQHAMDDLLAGGWQGSAANGFAAGWDEWSRGARDLLDALTAMSGLLGEAGRNYQHTEAAAADTLRAPEANL